VPTPPTSIFAPPPTPGRPERPVPSKPLPQALFIRWRALRPLLLINAVYSAGMAVAAAIFAYSVMSRMGLEMTDTWSTLAVAFTVLFTATVALTPAMHLSRYAAAVYRAAKAPSEEAMEAVLRRQMRLWRAVAILAVMMLMLVAAAALRQIWDA
jgi:hypothetical protein